MRSLIGGMGGGMFHPEMQFKDLLLAHILVTAIHSRIYPHTVL